MKAKSHLIFFICSFLFLGCIHSKIENDVRQKTNQNSDIKTINDLNTEASLRIEKANMLNNEQKQKLFTLRDQTHSQIEQNWTESLRLKSVLIKDLVEEKYNEKEVEQIKLDLKKNEIDKLSIIFDAVDQANSIMGRTAQLNGDIMSEIVHIRHD